MGGVLDLVAGGVVLWLVLLFTVYETSNFYLAYQECAIRQETNERTLRMVGVCDAAHSVSAEMRNACVMAERENSIGVGTCAWRSMWTQGELVRVWYMFTDSHWMLLGVSAALLACITYFGVSALAARQQRLLHREFMHMYRDPAALPPPPRGLLEAPERGNFVISRNVHKRAAIVVENDY